MRSSVPPRHGVVPAAPIIIGGLGGSGTRVVAEILQRSGVHLGHNLNTTLDNLTATVLFNRPAWASSSSDATVDQAFRRIQRMVLADDVNVRDRTALILAALRNGHTDSVKWRLRYAAGAGSDRKGPSATARAWGWKEPNSHLFLDSLNRVFAQMRFIYVVRHPLDMAFSTNTTQLRNWSDDFDVTAAPSIGEIKQAQLDWWITSTTKAVAKGSTLLGERFHMLNYEDLLEDPVRATSALLTFTEFENDSDTPNTSEIEHIAGVVERPQTAGRHRDHDVSIFRPDQLERIAEMGW